MKQSLKDFFEGVSIKNTLFLIIWTAGILGWIYFAVGFQDSLRLESWTMGMVHQLEQRRENKTEVRTDDKEVDLKKETSMPVILEGSEEPKNSSPLPSIETILPKIHQLESSGGKNDICKKYGKVNGYGFATWTGHLTCYNSKEEVEEEVSEWFKEKLKTKDLATAVCGYNLGFQSPYLQDCLQQSPDYPYYRNFVNI